jgi:hypothetical protein
MPFLKKLSIKLETIRSTPHNFSAICQEAGASVRKANWVTDQRLIKSKTSGTATGVQITAIILNIRKPKAYFMPFYDRRN